jgi:hypothetical protein
VDDAIWQTTGLQNAWQETIIHWASAVGITSFAMYCDLPLFQYTANQAADNPVTDHTYAAWAMQHLAPTDAAVSWQALSNWPAAALTGNASLTGKASIGSHP